MGAVPTIGEAEPARALGGAVMELDVTEDGASLRPCEVVVGGRLGRYEIHGRIAQGSMGVVYRAWDPELGRDLALKLLRDRGRRTTGASDVTEGASVGRARFVIEARAMAALSHPNVVRVFDVVREGATVFIAMELVEGKTLGQWLASSRDVHEVVQVFAAAARGLAAAHDAGVIHRDFKPSNVLVGNDGRVRVTDFGLALLADPSAEMTVLDGRIDRVRDRELDESSPSLTDTGVVVGTPVYMPPEQHYGRELDGRSDQYALCVALYEALHGVRPFFGESARSLAHAKESLDFVVPCSHRHVPRWLAAVVRRGLSPDPRHRFADMHALAAALERGGRGRAAMLGAAMVAGMLGIAVPGERPSGARVDLAAAVTDEALPGTVRVAHALADRDRRRAERKLAALYYEAAARGDAGTAFAAAHALADLVRARRQVAEARTWTRHAEAMRQRAAQ